MLSTKTPFLCPAAIAKSNSEDNPIQRIMETSAVADIQEISIMKKGFGKSPNAVFIALTVVSALLVTANSYAEDITVSKTIPNHLSTSPNETFSVVEDFVQSGKTGQKFVLKHGQCKGQDCKWRGHRTELFLYGQALIIGISPIFKLRCDIKGNYSSFH